MNVARVSLKSIRRLFRFSISLIGSQLHMVGFTGQHFSGECIFEEFIFIFDSKFLILTNVIFVWFQFWSVEEAPFLFARLANTRKKGGKKPNVFWKMFVVVKFED